MTALDAHSFAVGWAHAICEREAPHFLKELYRLYPEAEELRASPLEPMLKEIFG